MADTDPDAAEGDGELAVRVRLAELVGELVELRKRLGVSQRQMAHLAGLTAPLVNHIEVGRRRLTVETLERLAGPLGHDVDIRLVDRTAPSPSAEPGLDVEAVRPHAVDMYQAWLCPKCHARRHDRVPCCRRTLQPVWVAILPREVTP